MYLTLDKTSCIRPLLTAMLEDKSKYDYLYNPKVNILIKILMFKVFKSTTRCPGPHVVKCAA